MEKIYTAQEIAQQLKIKKTTVYELIKRGELQATKVGKQFRISQQQLDTYLGIINSGKSNPSVPIHYSENVRNTADSAILQMDYLLNDNGLIISSQESTMIEMLRSHMSGRPGCLPMLHSYMSSYNSLYSLYFEKAHLALISLPYKKEGAVDFTSITGLLPGVPVVILSLCDIQLSLYVRKGNPKHISSLRDFCRPDVRIMNREKGNECRILLDEFLKSSEISPASVNGYGAESLSHLSTANAVLSGKADVGIGDMAQLDAYPQLDCIPLTAANMVLVFRSSYMKHQAFREMQQIVSSSQFISSLKHFTGYNTHNTGELTFL